MVYLKFILLASVAISIDAFELPGGIGGGSGGETKSRNVFVTMKSSPFSIIDRIDAQQFPNRESKLSALRTGLMSNALDSQRPILNFLSRQSFLSLPLTVETMWISNQIYVKGISSSLVQTLTSVFSSSIVSIEDEKFSSISPIIFNDEITYKSSNDTLEANARQSNGNPTWGLLKIEARDVWKTSRGSGIIVGVIDTGVRRTHEAIVGKYVGDNNKGWFDPSGGTRSPVDGNGHGTHVTGTICGSNNIGVAPDAKWMACRGCPGNSCPNSDLLRCGQFMFCPHDANGRNEDCTKAPHIVSNSWGGGRSTRFASMIRSWRSGGIIPVFSAGNTGPDCGTIGSPADDANVLGVGSTTNNDELSNFSSKGPAGNLTKPDISAPGSNVYSAWNNADNGYRSISGTSMACPHVSGLIALLLSAKRTLKYDDVKNALFRGCANAKLKRPSRTCGGNGYPNNDFGQGQINAVNSMSIVRG